MVGTPQFSLEAHAQSATLYLHGAVSVTGILQAIRRCDELPETVWLLRVELGTARPLDAGTFAVLAHALRRWRESRSGITHLISTDTRDTPDPSSRSTRPTDPWRAQMRRFRVGIVAGGR